PQSTELRRHDPYPTPAVRSNAGVVAVALTRSRIHIPEAPCPGTPQKIKYSPAGCAVKPRTSFASEGSPSPRFNVKARGMGGSTGSCSCDLAGTDAERVTVPTIDVRLRPPGLDRRHLPADGARFSLRLGPHPSVRDIQSLSASSACRTSRASGCRRARMTIAI